MVETTNTVSTVNNPTSIANVSKRTPAKAKAKRFEMPVKTGKSHIASLSVTARDQEIVKLLKARNDFNNVDDRKAIRRQLRARDYYISEKGREFKVTTRKAKPAKVASDANNVANVANVIANEGTSPSGY